MSQQHSPIISVQNISKKFGDQAILSKVSFSVYPQEVFGIVGHSGSGKTTLLRCLDFLEFPTSGFINVAGFDNSLPIKKLSRCDFAKKVGYISQNYGLFSSKTVFENIAYPLRIHNPGFSKDEIEEKVYDTLNFLDLYHRKSAYPGNLSGGQKQKVAIARAIVCQPEVVLCDEITSALDPKSTEDIIERLLQLNQDRGVTLVLVSHEIDLIKKMCSHVLVMHQGSVEEFGVTEKLFLTSNNPITHELFHQDIATVSLNSYYSPKAREEILQLKFPKELAVQGIINKVLQTGLVSMNILSGNISLFRKTPIGFLIVVLEGEIENRKKAKEFLIELGVLVQEFF
ncbi:Methionine import ATP-binding protein MetN 2,DL-methionine transporter ATP-binding subunit,ABC-type spermidine/putrescine transport systems, ATPase components,D-methionine ABC transporter, ATP-binding protein,ABC transporter [Chlamydia serpentis]|uniref:ABC transporter domain-containing protein n=1 Tax=Chlamydia serpentis TaxID=1967782 RepID=A0A2R8FAI3_9CHLA|nr:methionine ABC transporter ATP-binding protein [Chlamydia serpentis]SPN73425.1 Methionine import ATP-binding protein MetN 2,DL-methionine transporter ATP-binding subunit,ABC-type spermidine/putrescine transport systems, ATPase components,D-methionine ABC transporter, ATP-binding protein,ABC transporter [Chlamydia serpentis]